MKAISAAMRRTEIQLLLITVSLALLISLAASAAPGVSTGA